MQDTFTSAASQAAWILSETKFRVRHLRAALPDASGFIGTFGDGYFRLLRKLLPGGGTLTRLSQSDEELLLLRLIRESSAFPVLRSELEQSPTGSLRLLKRSVAPIRRFIETVRVHERTELVLRELLDDFGNTKLGQERLTELFVLLEAYRTFQIENRTFDAAGVLEVLAEIVSRGPAALKSAAKSLPPTIVLDQPTELFPLERRVLLGLSRVVEVRLVLDQTVLESAPPSSAPRIKEFAEALPPSKRSLASVLYFARSELRSATPLLPFHSEREAALSAVFDGEDVTARRSFHGVEIWPAVERRDEIRRVARAIAYEIERGTFAPSDVHIVALDLDAYGEQFERSLAQLGAPAWLPKGRRLSETPVGSLLDALLQWAAAPSIKSLRALLVHPSYAVRTDGSEAFDARSFVSKFGEFQGLHSLLEQTQNESAADPVSSQTPIFQSFFALTELLGLPEGFLLREEWAAPILAYHEKRFRKYPPKGPQFPHFRELLRAMAAIDSERTWTLELANAVSDFDFASALRKRFHAVRKRLNRALSKAFLATHPAERRELSYAAAALREVRPVLRHADRYSKLASSGVGGEPLGTPLVSLAKNVSELLTSRFVALPPPQSAVAITELLDVRAMQSKVRFMVGFTADAFPPGARQQPGTELDRASLELTREAGKAGVVYEAYALFAHVMRSSDQLVLSFPQQGITDNIEPAPVLEQISAWIDPQPQPLFDEPPQTWRAIPAEENTFVERGIDLVRARESAGFTAYDSYLTGSVSREEIARASAGPNGASKSAQIRFSVSDLETMSDCPQRYFFQRVLGAATEKGGFRDLLAQETGNVVHDCLFEFHQRPSNRTLIRSDFAAACREMSQLARRKIQESVLSSLDHPFAQAQCERITLGLDEPGDTAKRGFLKAALVFERELMPEHTVKCEVDFNDLRIESEAGPIRVVGKIDRVDLSASDSGAPVVEAVWDYKTGPVKSGTDVQKCRSLQVPLYALAAQQLYSSLPKRGGMIRLGEPNRRGDDMKKGTLVEHLAYQRGKPLVPEQVEPTVQSAAEHVRALGVQHADAVFSQKLETQACDYCEFRQSCYRDEALLEKKITGEQRLMRSVPELPRPEPLLKTRPSAIGRLSAEQEAASEINRNIALTAGAGSGKTAVMCARAIRLVLDGAPLTSIVAITFTEKAALEIRARIERIIDQTLETGVFQDSEVTSAQRQQLMKARIDLPGAPIGTIHSLAANIVRMDPVFSGLGEYTGIAHGGEQAELIGSALDETFAGAGRPVVQQLLRRGVTQKALERQIPDLVRNRRRLDRLFESLTNETLREKLLARLSDMYHTRCFALASRLEEEVAEWLGAAQQWAGGAKLKPEQAADFEMLFEKAECLLKELGKGKEVGDAWAHCYRDLHDYAIARSSSSVRKAANRRNYWKDLRDELLGERRGEFDILMAGFHREQTGFDLAREVVLLARDVSSVYKRLKLTSGLVDFDDLIHTAHKMLCESAAPELRDRQEILRARVTNLYRHLMVDEFQDTDILQWEMVRSIVRAVFVNESRPGERSVFIVGDPQQAIYGFRGGDVRVFNQATHEIDDAGGACLSLKDNYRAHPEIISFVNELFTTLFAVDFDTDDRPLVGTAVSAQRMVPKREPEQCGPRVSALFAIKGKEDSEEGEADFTEADRVARLIVSALDPASAQFAKIHSAASGPKIAVLTRKVKDLELVGRALDARGVPYSISHSSGFFERDEILQFENLIRVLLDPRNEIALLGVLRSPLFGLSDADLVRLRIDLAGSWSLLWHSAPLQSPLAESVRSRLEQWRKLSVVLKPSQLFESIVEDACLHAVYLQAGEDERFQNIERFIDSLRCAEKSHSQGGSLRFAEDWFERQHADNSNAPTTNNAQHPVFLTTVHASKGLEFPMVILPYLKSKPRTETDFINGELELTTGRPVPLLGIRVEDDSSDFRRTRTFTMMLMMESEQQLTAAEERRLFYVACTRAKEYLVLSLDAEKKFKENQTRISERSERNRAEACFDAPTPWTWFRNLFEPDSFDSPSEWRLRHNAELSVPVIRDANDEKLPPH
ncbi:MAG: UvrD-helicase domain-containing protein [Bdellovibrionota bacterium]